MLHFLLIILALLGIWKLLAHGNTSSAVASRILLGLRRLALVLAIIAAALGGTIGYFDGASGNFGLAILGATGGFTIIWLASKVLIWILSAFLTSG
jgi:hypothetical protein